METKTYYIYTIADPQHNILAYVGETGDFDARKTQHMHEYNNTLNYFPQLTFPVTSSKENWFTWLHLMGITPVFSTRETIEGSKYDSQALERKYIKRYLNKGYALAQNTKLLKKPPCPYTKLWSDVWLKYQSLLPKNTDSKKDPRVIHIQSNYEQQVRLVNALLSRLRVERLKAQDKAYSIIASEYQKITNESQSAIMEYFADLRAEQKTKQLPLFEQKQAS